MSQNFIGCDREQVLLMPPSLQDWLPQNHLAWFVLDAVEEMDLTGFYAEYRGDGVGRPAHDPAVMVALFLYAYARGQRSSRRIEQACVEDIAYRVITANRAPDHTTIARFRQRHQDAIAGLFSDVLRLCADAGLAGVGLVAVDGTKVHADASHHANRDYEQIAREILAEADAVDAQEDEQFGDRRGDELPLELQTGRGRREWLRAGRKRLEQQRDADARPIPASRPERLKESKRRLQEELWAEIRANEEYLAYRARGVMSNGRRLGPSTVPKPWVAPDTPTGKINVTDPDSRNVKTPRGYMQGYNAQAVCNEQQIVIAAEITGDSPDFGHLQPMITATQRELGEPGSPTRSRSSSPTPATGTTSRWTNSPCATSPCSFPRTPANAPTPGRAGTAGATPSCAASLRPTSAPRCTPNARSSSNPSSPTRSSTAASTASNDEAEPPADPNGD